jgi:hypothetical protein
MQCLRKESGGRRDERPGSFEGFGITERRIDHTVGSRAAGLGLCALLLLL